MRTFFLMLLLFLASCSQKKEMPITEYTAGEGLLIDVRTPMEYELGHLQGAVNINWRDPAFKTAFDTIPKDQELYLYCQKGGRSAQAAAFLREQGYKVTDLLGGYGAFQP